MSTHTAPPGWHPDPAAPHTHLRWWDGTTWTEHVQAQSHQVTPAYPSAPVATHTSYGHGQWEQQPAWGYANPTQNVTFAQRNRLSLITAAVVAGYIGVAMTVGIVFVGILPILLSVRAVKRREPLAPFAVGAAIVAVIVAVAALSGH